MLYIIFARSDGRTLGTTPFIAEATAALKSCRDAGTPADWRLGSLNTIPEAR